MKSADRVIKILHVIKDLEIGGTENLLSKLVRQLELDFDKIENQILVLGTSSGASGEYLAMMRRPPIFLDFPGRYRDPLASLPCILKIRRLIRDLRPDIIHSYLWNADFFVCLARLGLDVAHVAHVVDRRGNRNSGRLLGRFKTRLTGFLHRKLGTRFVAVSEACREHAIQQYRVAPERILTAHNGISLDEFEVTRHSSNAEEPIVVGAISNFKPEKGHRYLIEAMQLVKDSFPQMRLLIAGEGRSRLHFEALTASLGLEDRISFVGRVASAAEFYKCLDFFVIPSDSAEGLPTTILEAMASGLPVVATDVGGAGEAVRSGMEGFLVPPSDSVALARALVALGSDRRLIARMSVAGLARVEERFTINRMTKLIVDHMYRPIYFRLIPSSPVIHHPP